MSVILRPHVPPFAGTRAAPLDTSAPWEPAEGGSGPRTMASISGILESWNFTAPAAGSIASITGEIAGIAAAQATSTKQPTASGGPAGASWDGGDVLVTSGLGAVVGGKSGLTVVISYVDSITAGAVIAELTASAIANNGSFSLDANAPTAGNLQAILRNGGANTTGSCAEADATMKVLTALFDYANHTIALRINGVAQSLTITDLATTGTSAADELYIGGRGTTPTAPITGSIGTLAIRNGVAQDADLAALERIVGARSGISF